MTFLVFGISAGATYALIAIGITLIYGTVRAYQLAHAAFAILLAYSFLRIFQATGGTLWAAILGTLLIAIAVSLLMSRIVFEPLLGRHFPTLVAAFGLTIIFEAVSSLYLSQGFAVSYPDELKLGGTVEVLGATVSSDRILAVLVTIVVLIAVELYVQKTRGGMLIRAVADDPDGAALCGTDVRRTIRTAFIIAGIAALVAGVLIGLVNTTLNARLAPQLFIKGIAAALLAGGASLRGTVVAALVIGISESLAVGYLSGAFSEVIAYGVIIVMLVVRPNGLFGHEEIARA